MSKEFRKLLGIWLALRISASAKSPHKKGVATIVPIARRRNLNVSEGRFLSTLSPLNYCKLGT